MKLVQRDIDNLSKVIAQLERRLAQERQNLEILHEVRGEVAKIRHSFGILAVAATFPVLAGVMIVRRVGEYALIRPGREMLFTAVDAQTKYKAKNAIDTVVYRGGDAIATVGNSGGQSQAGLYFEIRRQGVPNDPSVWCRRG